MAPKLEFASLTPLREKHVRPKPEMEFSGCGLLGLLAICVPAATPIVLFFRPGISAGLAAILFRTLNLTYAARVGTFSCIWHDEFLSTYKFRSRGRGRVMDCSRGQCFWDACESRKFGCVLVVGCRAPLQRIWQRGLGKWSAIAVASR